MCWVRRRVVKGGGGAAACLGARRFTPSDARDGDSECSGAPQLPPARRAGGNSEISQTRCAESRLAWSTAYNIPCEPDVKAPHGTGKIGLRTGIQFDQGAYFHAADNVSVNGHYFIVGRLGNTNYEGLPIFTPNESRIIDIKYDDGYPWSGNITVMIRPDRNWCHLAGQNLYLLSDEVSPVSGDPTYGCNIIFNAGF